MANSLIIFLYSFLAYGSCNVIAFGSGPFKIFEHLRDWATSISEHFGMLFSCMMCLPINFGLICSLFNWFLIPSIAFTPFNILFAGTNLWWLAMLCDAGFTSGIVWIIHQIESFFENIGETDADNNSLISEDITLKK